MENEKREMKMRESTICRQEMKKDLMKVYREVCRQYDCRNNREAWERVLNHRAPRYYVSAGRAHQRLSPLLRGDRSQIEKLSPLKQEMYDSLFETVLRLWQKKQFWGTSLYHVVKYAILQPAPKFYISQCRMWQIWSEMKGKEK